MKDSILVYFPYKLKESTTGSSVRPNKILKAFQEFCDIKNQNLIVISGNSKKRKKEFNKLIKSKMIDRVKYCYMENATLPIWLTDVDKFPRTLFFEQKFLRTLKSKGINIGLFYRDIYWKFPSYYPLKGWKSLAMQQVYKYELKMFNKFIDIMYLPSESMNEYVKFKGPIKPLPPAIENLKINNKFHYKNIIFVGSLTPKSGLLKLIELSKSIEKLNLNYKVTINCPKNNIDKYPELFEELQNKSFVNITHWFGEDLQKIYSEASIAIIPRLPDAYNDFAMPIKLFEYLENYLPVISTDVKEVGEFIQSMGFGEVFSNEDELEKILLTLLEEEVYRQYLSNIHSKYINHTWLSRIVEIDKYLTKKE